MKKIDHHHSLLLIALYFLLSLSLVTVTVWYLAIPRDVVEESIEKHISGLGNEIKADIKDLKRGIFFNLHAKSLDIEIREKPAVKIAEVSSRINPLYLLKKQLFFTIEGKIGEGNINGKLTLPQQGVIKIANVELKAIPYLTSLGFKGDGLISGSITLKNDTLNIIFIIPHANIQDSAGRIPLPLSSFHKIVGDLSIKGNIVQVNSISLEGKKGYARLKGSITNRFMDLTLELMPVASELTTLESTLIRRHEVSPGYYVITIKGAI